MGWASLVALMPTLIPSGCAGASPRQKPTFSLAATGSGSGSLIAWGTAPPACGSHPGGGAAFRGAYLYESPQKSRGPSLEW